MTTPFDPNSKSENSVPKENFSIRTMHDDLLKIQTTGKIEATPIENSTPRPQIFENASQQKASPIPEEIPNEKYNPFATVPSDSPAQSAPISITEQAPQISENNSKSSVSVKIIWTLIIIFILSIIALGGYYYWSTQEKITVIPEISEQIPEVTEPIKIEEPPVVKEETPPIVITQPVEKYSTTKPNYLVLDTNNTTAEPIKETISKISDELKRSSSSQALYEFIPVDINNAPIAFPIFTIAAKLNLSSKVLSNLGTDFSLFLYNDNGEIRLAITSKINKTDTLAANMLIQEKTFIEDADFLFLRMIPDKTNAAFGSSSYNNIAVRYLNASLQKNLSIDYAITESHLIIGTSKNTLRAVMDASLKNKIVK